MATHRTLLMDPIKEGLCRNANIEDLIKLRDYLGLTVLKCPIPVNDSDHKISQLDQVDNTTLDVYEEIKSRGSIGALKHFAIYGKIPEMQTLLRHKLDVNQKDENGSTALHHTASYGEIEAIKFLLKMGADINAVDKRNETPLIEAIIGNHKEAVILLLQMGANSNLVNKYGETALDHAIKQDNPEIIQILSSKNLDDPMLLD